MFPSALLLDAYPNLLPDMLGFAIICLPLIAIVIYGVIRGPRK